MVRLVAAVSALAIVLSGCAKGIAGSAVSNEEAAQEATSPLTARQRPRSRGGRGGLAEVAEAVT